jgi:hypothetical protein
MKNNIFGRAEFFALPNFCVFCVFCGYSFLPAFLDRGSAGMLRECSPDRSVPSKTPPIIV